MGHFVRWLVGAALGAWCCLAPAQVPLLVQSPGELRVLLASMDPQAQRQWLLDAYDTQALERASDAQLDAILQTVPTSDLFFAVRQWLVRNPDYEFVMLRQERLQPSGDLPALPERMLVRYRHLPRAVYALWQEGGARSGQEVLYDASRDGKSMRAHLGGLLGKISFTMVIDGPLSRLQSRHTVLDIGFQFILDQLERDTDKLKARAIPLVATAAVVHDGAQRYLEIALSSPGWPDFYARTTRVRLRLERPVIQQVESEDNEGTLFERTVFERVSVQTFGADAFNLKNPQYHF